MTAAYPDTPAERDRWILSQRSPRAAPDLRLPQAVFVEPERGPDGRLHRVLTILLSSRECPWRCVMCDLWKTTSPHPVPAGAVPAQIEEAWDRVREDAPPPGSEPRRPAGSHGGIEAISQVKLYNSGSFFDPLAVPMEDYAAIAARMRGPERVIVECHPALVGDRCLRFRDALAAGSTRLEVALGLETANPEVLEKLNKRMTLDQFRRAAEYLLAHGMDLRVFVLVRPPFLGEEEALVWARRSIDLAFDCGATAVSLIPVRPGNGALDALGLQGLFAPPRLGTVEAAAEYGVSRGRGRVFVDLWDLGRFSDCAHCREARRDRLQTQNLRQEVAGRVVCPACSGR